MDKMIDIHLAHHESKMSDKLLNIFFKVETTHWWWVARKKIVIDLLKIYLKNNNNLILDAGCGTGAGILYLDQFGKVCGVDLSTVAVDFCKKRGLKNVKVGNVSKLPFKDNLFDLVCLMDVIEHIDEEKIALKEIYRVLKPGGLLLMTLPALPFIYSDHDKAQGHFRRYSKDRIKKLLINSGLNEIKISYFNIFLSPPIIFIRLLSRVGGPFSKLADFDSKLNYDLSKKKSLNNILTQIFSIEANILKLANIPFGISLLTIHRKPKSKL